MYAQISAVFSPSFYENLMILLLLF